ncbi:MAG: site-specific DNA-methyltransferase [Salinivirgaceae bacterium]|nr:site-specific DNA-methyltransferase [Salinivirgaceae bacterium]
MSTNISKLHREDLLDKIRQIRTFIASAPQDANTGNLLQYLDELTKDVKGKKYGLVFERHREQIDDILDANLPVLTEQKDLFIDNGGQMNFLIEGDNLAALQLLEKTHKGRIDVIYIDPPYNTGAKDWKYNNDYVDGKDTFRHSKWLSMMAVRLEIAKGLLKDNGALICAIDENELATTKLLLEEVFGVGYKIDPITIVHNPRGVQGDNFSYVNEYALFVYPKGQKIIENTAIEEEEIQWSPLRNWGTESERLDAANCFYPILVKDGQIIGFGEDVTDDDDFHPKQTEFNPQTGIYSIYPIDAQGVERKWRYARQSVESILHLLRVKEIENGYDIELGKNFAPYRTVWTDKKFDANEYGTQLIGSMVPNNDFSFPKSVYNVYECIRSITLNRPNAIVLDYFAGSGTTGHAILMLNKDIGGNRRFILCTNNEVGNKKEKEFKKQVGNIDDHKTEWEEFRIKYGIASSVTYPRIKKAIKGFRHSKDYKVTLYQKNLTPTILYKPEKTVKEINAIIENNKAQFDSIKKEIEDSTIKVIGVTKKKQDIEGFAASLKYYKIDFVPISEQVYYEYADELLLHIRELVELENGINFNGNSNIAIVLTDEEMEQFVADKNTAKILYRGHNVLFSAEQDEYVKTHDIQVNVIPNYYYNELNK